MSKRTPRLVAMVLVLVFVFSAAALAQEVEEDRQLVIPDLLVGKPFGLLALTVGGLTYLVTLPITLPLGWHREASETLVKRPYRWTFHRGLGEDLDSY